MRNNYLIFLGGMAITIIIAFYVLKFFPIFGSQLSEDTAVWGQFGDYIGGTLNPILSFLSVVLLIRSATLQKEANAELKKELKNSERTENFRLFNTLFFNMIESQKNIFREFKIYFYEGHNIVEKTGAAAVLHMEEEIENLRDNGVGNEGVADYLSELDSEDQIFGVLRAFYTTVKIICDKIVDENGFKEGEARDQIITLINFTDFSQLRLVVIGTQFLNYKSCEYLRGNNLFISSLNEVKLSLDLY
ncbi:hypothetical protein [Janthinobacterium sp. FW305-129]|uniref:hypothetical protein n=1 Tax=Janthinobacterium sp. FW305-129 TaxID=2775054 RepID=UPI001E3221F5|nr:hypothetical protein [Janthinobacterium sp. FW305-129]